MELLYRTDADARRFRVLHTADGQVYQGDGPDVGQPATWISAPPQEGVSPEVVLAALRGRAAAEGYAPPEDAEVHSLMIQYPLEGWGSGAELARRHAIEQLLSAVLVGSGFGTVDGGDIGSGKLTIWAAVVAPARAAAACVERLREAGHLEGAILVSAAPDDDGPHTPHWPEGYDVETFSVL